jgi:hypothetical protein
MPPVKINKFWRKIVDRDPNYYISTVICEICGDNIVVHKYKHKGRVRYGIICSGHLMVHESDSCTITTMDGKRPRFPRAEPKR